MGLFDYRRARRQREAINRVSHASDPGGVMLSVAKLRRLAPELFPSWWKPWRWIDRISGSCAAQIFRIGDRLIHGDSRAALVMSVDPCLVAAYTDELDCIVMLAFPPFIAEEYQLQPFDRLLAVFNYWQGDSLASDLSHGTASYRRYANVLVLIADFLSNDVKRIAERKAEIDEDEWDKTRVLAEEYLKRHGQSARDGSPTRSHVPAVPIHRLALNE